jgi:hypothetical protein
MSGMRESKSYSKSKSYKEFLQGFRSKAVSLRKGPQDARTVRWESLSFRELRRCDPGMQIEVFIISNNGDCTATYLTESCRSSSFVCCRVWLRP